MPGTDTLDAGLGKQTASGVIMMYLHDNYKTFEIPLEHTVDHPPEVYIPPSLNNYTCTCTCRDLEKEAQAIDPEAGPFSREILKLSWVLSKSQQLVQSLSCKDKFSCLLLPCQCVIMSLFFSNIWGFTELPPPPQICPTPSPWQPLKLVPA